MKNTNEQMRRLLVRLIATGNYIVAYDSLFGIENINNDKTTEESINRICDYINEIDNDLNYSYKNGILYDGDSPSLIYKTLNIDKVF